MMMRSFLVGVLLVLCLPLGGATMCDTDSDVPMPCAQADGGVCASPWYVNRAFGVIRNGDAKPILALNVYWQNEPAGAALTVNGVVLQCQFTPGSRSFPCAGGTWTVTVEAADEIVVKFHPYSGTPGNGTALYYKFSGDSSIPAGLKQPSQIGTLGEYDWRDQRTGTGRDHHADVYWRAR
jgi:hypothetical protein